MALGDTPQSTEERLAAVNAAAETKRAESRDDTTPRHDKPAPVVVNDPLPEIAAEVQSRKPRHGAAQRVVDAVKGAVSGNNDRPSPTKPDPSAAEVARKAREKREAIIAKDTSRMRAVKRYRAESREAMGMLARIELKALGHKNVSEEKVKAIVAATCKVRSFAGFYVNKQGDTVERKLPLHDLLAYTLGSIALGGVDIASSQWLAHPTLFDIAVIGAAFAQAAFLYTDEDSAVRVAIRAIIENGDVAAKVTTAKPAATPSPRVDVPEAHETHEAADTRIMVRPAPVGPSAFDGDEGEAPPRPTGDT